MKIYYFNDEDHMVLVYTNDMMGNPKALRPARGAMFEFDAPQGSVPYVKVWNGVVLLSYMDPPAFEDPRIA